MTANDVLDAIAAADLPRLGFRPPDAADFRGLAATLAHDTGRMGRVARLAETLRARIGRFFEDDLPVRDDGGLASFDEGLDTLLALVAVSGEVHDAYLRRGVPGDLAWRALSDLGQQVHVSRQIFGFFGLAAQTWCVENYTGRHLWLGRLQFTLERTLTGHALGIHIPEGGPLCPDAVDDALAQASAWAPRVFPEYPIDGFELHSWLLNPDVIGALPPESNLARFAARFELDGEAEGSPHDFLFFVFHVEPALQPVDLSALPRASALQRAVLDAWEKLAVRSGRLISPRAQ